jgi:hypothetical protein
MNWIGSWKNQYGSVLEITKQEGDKLEGTFESAVDKTTHGQKLEVCGYCNENLIAVTCTGGDHVVSYTGMFYQGKMETAWHVVTAGNDWWASVKTNVDTFEKISE